MFFFLLRFFLNFFFFSFLFFFVFAPPLPQHLKKIIPSVSFILFLFCFVFFLKILVLLFFVFADFSLFISLSFIVNCSTPMFFFPPDFDSVCRMYWSFPVLYRKLPAKSGGLFLFSYSSFFVLRWSKGDPAG